MESSPGQRYRRGTTSRAQRDRWTEVTLIRALGLSAILLSGVRVGTHELA